ncbi:hypothetical protein EFR66_03255 [Lactobacillus delbrueckii subsp. lactis]|nr:hypothetical protein [Lactobacillus delbrueckii subsp. lactis]
MSTQVGQNKKPPRAEAGLLPKQVLKQFFQLLRRYHYHEKEPEIISDVQEMVPADYLCRTGKGA